MLEAQRERQQLGNLRERMRAKTRLGAPTRQYKTDPVCVDLQNQIFQCYQQNPKETLSCSALAAEYFKCVQHARQCSAGQGG
ncbi:MICOS complex subunit MIC19-like [Crotalus adamanteus]|uniref:MICOS complex subunit MIC19-like n=1 Tax=Crotalus adamanteus TaxID=8729 RepID=A0AAW1BE10_CROAD